MRCLERAGSLIARPIHRELRPPADASLSSVPAVFDPAPDLAFAQQFVGEAEERVNSERLEDKAKAAFLNDLEMLVTSCHHDHADPLASAKPFSAPGMTTSMTATSTSLVASALRNSPPLASIANR